MQAAPRRIYLLASGIEAMTADRKALRFHFDCIGKLGSHIYVETAQIRTRSLASVGGARPGCNHTKRANKRARRAGYPDWKSLIQAMMRMAKGDMAAFRRLMSGLG